MMGDSVVVDEGRRDVVVSAGRRRGSTAPALVTCNAEGILEPATGAEPRVRMVLLAPEVFDALEECAAFWREGAPVHSGSEAALAALHVLSRMKGQPA